MADTMTPTRDVILFDTTYISEESIADILLEDIGGIELLSLARRDTIDGLNPYYSIISNLSKIRREYDTSQMISQQRRKQSYFDIYPIDLETKIPSQEYLDEKGLTNWYYLDESGNLVIELDNLKPSENIEVEVAQVL
jgi:hypothetical protein